MTFSTSYFSAGACYITPVIDGSYLVTDYGIGATLITITPEWVIIRDFYDAGRKSYWRAIHSRTMKAAWHDEKHPAHERAEEAFTFLEAIADNYGAIVICDDCELPWDMCEGHD